MRSIPLSSIYLAAKDRKAGYIEEVMKRGKIFDSSVLLSEEDFNFISKNFALGSFFETAKVEQKQFVEKLAEKKNEPVKAETTNVPEVSLDVDHYHLDHK